ncbi:response regulator transcription factor [uncultured Paenibacillus sp.]|uniref:response regulator transcription factor n=1 Tax=uncultured Paenibacillus sp. TaxID=227322 RepID=UPI0028D31F7E|nr:response regulator transcription factor [uncultured Paenibacillus sp.]
MFKVVLVDDEVYARQGLRQFTDWNKYGFDIIAEAANGEEALRVIEETKPDLVVTDIRMPVLDGLQLIQAVKERKQAEPSFVIVSGYGDFKYAQQAVKFGVKDFILKPIDEEEMEQTLQALSETITGSRQLRAEHARLLNQPVFDKWVTGALETALAADMVRALGLKDDGELRYFDVELNDLHSVPDDALSRWKTDITGAIAGLAGQTEVYIHERQRGIFGFVAGRDSLQLRESSWKQFAGLLQQRLRGVVGEKAKVMLYGGMAVKGTKLVPESYRTAGEAMAHKYAAPGDAPLLFEELEGRPVRHAELDDGIYAGLLESVEEHEPEKARRAIDGIFDRFRTERHAPDTVARSLSRFVFSVVRIVESMQGDKSELAALDPLLSLSQSPVTLQGLKAAFIRFIEESSAYIAEVRKQNAKGGIRQIRQYIEAHYDQNMSLKSIAATFYMNPVYLGQLFKKTYGVYFNEFLLHTRIREAKRLLRQTQLRVYEIADKVGFSNADYFVTQFEKVEHKTPSEYRNALCAKK